MAANNCNAQCCLAVEMEEIPGTHLYKQWGGAELASASLSFHIMVSSGQSSAAALGNAKAREIL